MQPNAMQNWERELIAHIENYAARRGAGALARYVEASHVILTWLEQGGRGAVMVPAKNGQIGPNIKIESNIDLDPRHK